MIQTDPHTQRVKQQNIPDLWDNLKWSNMYN